MQNTIETETDNTHCSTEAENLVLNTPGRLSDKEQNSLGVSVTSEEVARQAKAVTDPLKQHVAHQRKAFRKMENEQYNARHEEAASFKAASLLSSIVNRLDNKLLAVSINGEKSSVNHLMKI